MQTNDNDAYGDLDKSNLKCIYEQFLVQRRSFMKGLQAYCAYSAANFLNKGRERSMVSVLMQ